MNNGLVYAVIAAVCLAFYLILNRKAGADPAMGTFLVRAAGFAVATLFLLNAFNSGGMSINATAFKGWHLVVLAGVLIAIGDFFMFKAFSSGLPVSIAGPVISGGAVVFAALGGIVFFGESITWTKGLGIGLAALAAILISA
jgi:drug/metabolite transporter (DMT)-like permease